MGLEEGLVLVDLWVSPFAQRVRIALAEKGLTYESREEDLANKSPLLLEYNPVWKKIPVLIHDGRPVCESLVIVEYIGEVWPHTAPILPADPLARAHARFWAGYVGDRIFLSGNKMWKLKGEALEEAKIELIAILKTLESELGDKTYFGGEEFGLIDIALVPFTTWFYTYEKCGGLVVEEHCPKLVAWGKRCMARESVARSLHDPEKVHEFVVGFLKKWLRIE